MSLLDTDVREPLGNSSAGAFTFIHVTCNTNKKFLRIIKNYKNYKNVTGYDPLRGTL